MTLTLPWPPSVNHYWRHASGVTYLSAEGKAYKLAVKLRSLANGRLEPLGCPVVVRLWAYRPRRVGDLDNALKAVLDALKGIAFVDDAQVVELHAWRGDDKARPRVEVKVTPATGAPHVAD